MNVRRSVLPALTLLLITSACAGSEGADTTTQTDASVEATGEAAGTTTPDTTLVTTSGAVTLTTATTTRSNTTATETTATDITVLADVPVNIAAAGFNFLAGTSPRVLVTVSISAAGPDGPWQPAGAPPGPSLETGSDFWVRLEIENTSSNATMSELNMSVPGVGAVCGEFAGLEPLDTFECVVGPLVAEEGNREIEFDLDATGSRQGEDDGSIIDPPLRIEHSFDGAAHAFTFLFAVDLAALDGVLVDGSAPGPTIVVEGLGLAAPVAIDCSDSFAEGFSETGGGPQSGEPRVFAYAITNYNGGGSVAGTCSNIPTFESTFVLADDSDSSINYTDS